MKKKNHFLSDPRAVAASCALIILAAAAAVLVLSQASCAGANKAQVTRVANDGVALVDKGCVFVVDLLGLIGAQQGDSGAPLASYAEAGTSQAAITPAEVCATIDDLAPLLPQILAIQHARLAGATRAQLRAMVRYP